MAQNRKVLTAEDIANLRKHLFSPCQSKEHLHSWVKVYLGLDLPDVTICTEDSPPSNTNPTQLLWDMYQAAMDGTTMDMAYNLLAAGRDTYKTIFATVFEMLCIFHLRRSVGHLAAVESQAKRGTTYITKYFKSQVLAPFLTSKNKRTIEVTYYLPASDPLLAPESKVLAPSEYEALTDEEKAKYYEHSEFVEIIVATMSGTNSLHCSMLILDELELAPPKPVEEAKMIVGTGRHGELGMTFMLSSRKFAFGNVQAEMDNASKTKLRVNGWNLIDVTKKCEPSRHLPNLPKVTLYRSDSLLSHITPEEFDSLPNTARGRYVKDTAFAGCQKCPIYAACKGRLATKQTSNSALLKPIDQVIQTFNLVSTETALSQLLNRKPSAEGMIYPYFDRSTHMLTAREIAERVTGVRPLSPDFGKKQLIQLFKDNGIEFYAGLDHGYTHPFAVVSFVVVGHIAYVFDVQAVPRLELDHKIDWCKKTIAEWDPAIYPDTAYPADNATFLRKGFRMRPWKKGPDSVTAGISIMRTKLWPAVGPPTLFFLRDDDGCEALGMQLSKYHWKINANGDATDEPEKKEDDLADSCRYGIQNVFDAKGGVVVVGDVEDPNVARVSPYEPGTPISTDQARNDLVASFMRDQIEQATSQATLRDVPSVPDGVMKRGELIWEIE